MSTIAKVLIHASQFPEMVRRDLLDSLRARRVNHKFHYDSVKQTQKWLALHQAYSPTRNDADCAGIYDRGFAGGSGTGQIEGGSCHRPRLRRRTKRHASAEIVEKGRPGNFLHALRCQHGDGFDRPANRACQSCRRKIVFPSSVIWPPQMICTSGSLGALATGRRRPSLPSSRLLTFFGMIPNFEPQIILPKLASLVRPKDFLLFSANLAPGTDYAAGVKKVLPQYDNSLTRDWLMTFLLDLGVERNDGKLRFKIEDDRTNGLKRIVAGFHFTRARRVEVDGEQFDFRAGETIQLFFSYRYTPEHVRKVLACHGLEVCEQWIAKSEEEGVFLVQRKSTAQVALVSFSCLATCENTH